MTIELKFGCQILSCFPFLKFQVINFDLHPREFMFSKRARNA